MRFMQRSGPMTRVSPALVTLFILLTTWLSAIAPPLTAKFPDDSTREIRVMWVLRSFHFDYSWLLDPDNRLASSSSQWF
jgi:hypothetical protein